MILYDESSLLCKVRQNDLNQGRPDGRSRMGGNGKRNL
jgi:hypothetical protein